MKIDIAESLISSYLSHVEQCRIVQTNWKTSGNWVLSDNLKENSESFFNKISKDKELSFSFKNSSFEQFIKQAEIDVLGINTIENSVFAYDIAFHEAGLNYVKTVPKVLNKIVRSICVSKIYFSDYQTINSFFVTPKCADKHIALLQEKINHLNQLINDENIVIGFISNNDFYDKIFSPTIESLKNENNTGELFARAIKLINLGGRMTNTKISKIKKSTATVEGMKIGQYVKETFYKLNKDKRLSQTEISNLQDPDYCKKTFNSNEELPVLRENTMSRTNSKGYTRYYKDEFIQGYWLSSQWYEKQREKFENWEQSLNKS